jgi:acyl carrier protein
MTLSFESFAGELARRLDLPAVVPLEPGSLLAEDWRLDSLQMLELVLELEDLTGRALADDLAWSLKTVDDAFRVYSSPAP